jgi:hypothetical protein
MTCKRERERGGGKGNGPYKGILRTSGKTIRHKEIRVDGRRWIRMYMGENMD